MMVTSPSSSTSRNILAKNSLCAASTILWQRNNFASFAVTIFTSAKLAAEGELAKLRNFSMALFSGKEMAASAPSTCIAAESPIFLELAEFTRKVRCEGLCEEETSTAYSYRSQT